MRFCMVTTFYPPYHFGGDAVFVQALARALVAKGHHVEVVHCEDAYRLRGQEQQVAQVKQDKVVMHRLRSSFGQLSPFITQQTGTPGVKTIPLRTVLDRDFDVVNFHNISLIADRDTVPVTTMDGYSVSYQYLLQFNKTAKERQQASLIVLRPSMQSEFGELSSQLYRDKLEFLDLSALRNEFTEQAFKASRFDGHPSAAVHHRIGEAFAEYIQKGPMKEHGGGEQVE